MKKLTSIIVLTGSLAWVWTVYARDIKRFFPIADAMADKDLQAKLDESTKTSFGKENTPQGLKILRSEVGRGKVALRGKTNEAACNTAFISALVDLQQRAKQAGANAIVTIVSYYKSVEMASATEFECHEGSGYMAVALKGNFVKINDS